VAHRAVRQTMPDHRAFLACEAKRLLSREHAVESMRHAKSARAHVTARSFARAARMKVLPSSLGALCGPRAALDHRLWFPHAMETHV
jgi:hypothetical protein